MFKTLLILIIFNVSINAANDSNADYIDSDRFLYDGQWEMEYEEQTLEGYKIDQESHYYRDYYNVGNCEGCGTCNRTPDRDK